jgi:dolichyl-phosphate beta-glucosyltransferase
VDVVDLSVVIPAFNEQARIGASIEAVCRYLRQSGRSWEVIVVDDGSSDRTAAIAAALADREPGIRLIRSARNGGKGHALRTGVLASRGAEVLVSDADLSTPIGEVERLWEVRDGAVAAIGSRVQRSTIELRQSRLRETLGRLGNLMIRAVAVRGISDTQCGFKLFKGPQARALFQMARLNGWAIDVEILHLCARFGWPVVEVPVRWSHAAGSKLRPTAYLQVLGELAYLRLAHRQAVEPRLPGRV